MAEFSPDIVLVRDMPLGEIVDIYLDGELQEQCFEARVTWRSFDEPAFGELIVRSRPEPSMIASLPRLGEFDYDGFRVKHVCGRVEVRVAKGKEAQAARWIEIYKRHG